jgi:hypothetical protein
MPPKLSELQEIPNAAQPTAGVGLTLDLNGNVPYGATPTQTYAPSIYSTTGSPSLGNGSITGGYFQVGRMVFGGVNLTIGSTTNLGTGFSGVTLPVPIAALTWIGNLGWGYLYDSSASSLWTTVLQPSGTSAGIFLFTATGGGFFTTATTPAVWASGDSWVANFTYFAG